MCTCLAIKNNDTYFGRNLDLDSDFGQMIVVTPRNFALGFKKEKTIKNHYAFIGIGTVIDGYPLYADATNEHGLSIAGLRFEGFAKYNKPKTNFINIATFELIPYLLGLCKNTKEALNLLKRINVLDANFNSKVEYSNLHWMIADKTECYVIESTVEGLKVYKNPYGVLTNNPPFPYHLENLRLYLGITNEVVESRFSDSLTLTPFTSGQGTFGLPGDYTSPSRFIKAAYLANNFKASKSELSNVSQFFHILDNVSVVRGAVLSNSNKYMTTIYSSCVNVDKVVYYCKTYNNSRVVAVELKKEDLKSNALKTYSIESELDIRYLS